MKSRWIK